MGSLGRKAVKGTIYLGVSHYILYFAGFVVNIILARYWLKPMHFGIFAVAESIYSYIFLFSFTGHDQALRAWTGDYNEAANTHRWLTFRLMIAVLFVTAIFFFLFGWLYPQDPDWTILRWAVFYMGICGLTDGLTRTNTLLFEKELMYRELTYITLINQVVKYTLTIILAYYGFGVFSLVFGMVSGSVLKFIIISIASPFRIKMIGNRSILRDFFRFGPYWHYFLTLIGTTSLAHLANVIIKIIGNATSVGLYVRALGQARLPTQHITHVLGSTALATYCKVQNERDELSRAFSLMLNFLVRLTLPVGIILLIVADEMIILLYKETWAPAIPVFYFLSVYCLLRPVYDDCGALLTAVKRFRVINNLNLIQSGLYIVTMPVLAYLLRNWTFMGADGVSIGAAIGLDFAMVVGVILVYSRVKEFVDVDYKKAFIPPVISIICSAALAVLLWNGVPFVHNMFIWFSDNIFGLIVDMGGLLGKQWTYDTVDSMRLAGLIAKGIMTGVFYIAILLLLERDHLIKEVRYIVSKFRSRDDKNVCEEK